MIARLLALTMLLPGTATAQSTGRTLEGTPVIVTAPAGWVEGRAHDGVEAFAGIPYAQPPVGDLRWRAPRPMPRWPGVRTATDFANDCPQIEIPGDLVPSTQPKNEDCLYLHLWRPARAKALPVMVWIHGGGFVAGSSASPVSDGGQLAKRGVIVVGFNYRLGRFGFFAHPALTDEAGGKPLANYAFQDMIAALKWVRANIAAFGGDRDSVTIFGESAGGAAVQFLLGSPEASGLFHKAIVQSGANREAYARLATDRPGRISAEKAGLGFTKAAGLPDTADAAALRALSATTVQGRLSLFDQQPDRFTGPVIDGAVVPTDPIDRFSAGAVPTIPYMIGATGAELSQESFASLLIPFIESQLNPAALAELKTAYGDPLPHRVIDLWFFGEAARGYARIMAARGKPTWQYRFDYVPEGGRVARKLAQHASEIQFVFGNLPPGATAADRAVADQAGAYWTNFARTGDPNGGTLPHWPKAGRGDPLLVFGMTGPGAAHDDDPRLDTILRVQSTRPR